MREFILRNPFASGGTLGIFTVVECVASLAKNQYPVPLELLSDTFTLAVGNQTRWNQPKTRRDATRMYVEYAAQLGLLARVGDRVYLTPTGALQPDAATAQVHPAGSAPCRRAPAAGIGILNPVMTQRETTIVIFGATGDLTRRLLLPALLQLCRAHVLPPSVRIVLYARRPYTLERYPTRSLRSCRRRASR